MPLYKVTNITKIPRFIYSSAVNGRPPRAVGIEPGKENAKTVTLDQGAAERMAKDMKEFLLFAEVDSGGGEEPLRRSDMTEAEHAQQLLDKLDAKEITYPVFKTEAKELLGDEYPAGQVRRDDLVALVQEKAGA